MAVNVSSNYTMTITPEMAQQILSTCPYEYQRKIRKSRVALYATMMESNSWVNGSNIKFAVMDKTGRKILTNGFHRLTAVIVSGRPQVFAVTEVACGDESDLARVYYTEDRSLARSDADAFRTLHIELELGISSWQINKASAAMRFIYNDFARRNYVSPTTEEVVEMLRAYADAIGLYFEVTAGRPRYMEKPLMRSAVMSVAFEVLRFAPMKYGTERCIDFWKGMAIDDGLTRTDPRKVANVHIVNTRISMTSGGGRNGSMASAAYQARYVANCWNAWSEGRVFASFNGKAPSSKVFDAGAPIVINGTSWDGTK